MTSIYVLNRATIPVTITSSTGNHTMLLPGYVTQVDVSFNWALPNTVSIVSSPSSPTAPNPTAQFIASQPETLLDSAGTPFGTFANPLYTGKPGTSIEVVPTVTAGAYTSGYVIGGIMHFTNILSPAMSGQLESIALKFKATVQTIEFDVALFTASPAGTFGDHVAPVIAAGDSAIMAGLYALTANKSPLGTHTQYELDNVVHNIISNTTRDLWAVVVCKGGAPTNPASTTDMSLRLGVSW